MHTIQYTLVVTGALNSNIPPLQTSFEIEPALAHTYARKLSANYCKPADRHIWHVPGFSGFEHRCPDPIRDGDEARPKGAR